MVTNKRCTECKQLKPLNDFGKLKASKDGINYTCKKCIRQKRVIRKTVVDDGFKMCASCCKILPIENFNNSTKSKDGFSSACKECKPKNNKRQQHYRRREYVLLRNRKIKEDIIQQMGSTCEICGESVHPACFDFHHRNPGEKEQTIAYMISRRSKQELQEEIKKCMLLCAHCHKILHYEENTKRMEDIINGDYQAI